MASKLVLLAVCVVACAVMVSARPRFLAIPIEDVKFINGVPYLPHPMSHHRIARRALADDQEPEAAADNSYGSGYHGNDHVDYGAYTGGYGAFGWYADYPVGGDHYGKH